VHTVLETPTFLRDVAQSGVLLPALIDKGERADLSQADRNALRIELQGFAEDYRAGVRAKIAVLRKGRRR